MGRSPDERLTKDVAHEICLREGVKAMLTGSIASLGSHYVITLEAINAQTGDTLDREQVEAESKEQVLKSLDKAASSLREKLGESIGSVQKFAAPLEAATTSSLDALKEFSIGAAAHARFDDEAAIPHLQRAVELDPNFAMAWATLGVAASNQTNHKRAAECLKKAFDLKDRTSEREKFYISAHYYETATHQTDQSIRFTSSGSRPILAIGFPATTSRFFIRSPDSRKKDFANAIEAMQLDAKDPYAYQNMAASYQCLGRYDEAKAVAEQAIEKKVEPWSIRMTLYYVAYIRGDEKAMQEQLDASKNGPGEPVMQWLKADGECAHGKIKQALKATPMS